jgi:hypothetical protein
MIHRLIQPVVMLFDLVTDLTGALILIPQKPVWVLLLLFYSVLIIWPASLIRELGRGNGIRPERLLDLRSLARLLVWIGVLIHSTFMILMLMLPGFELLFNTGHPYTLPALHLVLNWSLVLSAATGLLAGVVAIIHGWWRPLPRIHFVVVTICLLITLGFFHYRQALILFN